MNNLDTTITIKKAIKKRLKTCKEYSRESWVDLMIWFIEMYKEVKNSIEIIKY